jgi:hypothetical protein
LQVLLPYLPRGIAHTSHPFFLVPRFVFLVAASPPSFRPSPWPWPWHAHAHILAHTHVPVHPRTCTNSPGRRRTSPFTFEFPRPNRARRRFAEMSRGIALCGVFPPGGVSVGSFLSSHACSRACTHRLSPTPATPARRHFKFSPRICCQTGGVVHACVTKLRPAYVLAPALVLATRHRRQPQPRRCRLGVCRCTGRDLNLATPVVHFKAAPFLPLVDHMDPVNLTMGLAVQLLSILVGGKTLPSCHSL